VARRRADIVPRVSPSNITFFRWTAVLAAAFATIVAGCSGVDRAPRAVTRIGCDEPPLAAGDLKGILRAPITLVEPGPADARTCVFRTDSHARIEVAIRPSGGATTVQRWLEGAMPLEAVPLPGVGDRGAWQRDLHEVIAERGDVLCDVTAVGDKSDFADTASAFLESRLGALCVRLLDAPPQTTH
jgi:hypothetical protein